MASYWKGNPYKRPRSPYWHIFYQDASGILRRLSTKTTDLRIARQRLSDTLREVELLKAGHIDRYAAIRKRPLKEVYDEFRVHLEADGCAPQYMHDTMQQLRAFASFAKVPTVPALTAADAIRFLEGLAAKRSAKTRDNYAGALHSFGTWLRKSGRWDCNPFTGINTRTAKRDKHRVFQRVGLRFEEAERLVEAVWARYEAEKARAGRPSHKNNADGELIRDRQVLYWFTLTTGFRAKECASVRWEDLTLDGPRPSVRLSGHFTKNGDDANIPLQPFVAKAIQDMRRRRSERHARNGQPMVQESDTTFAVPDRIGRLVRKDAAFAGLVPLQSPSRRRIDFHALRKSCARILIELGIHPKFIQQMLRHSDIRLTMDLYGELGEDDLFREMPGKFPVPRMFAESAPDGGGSPVTATA